ncbi:hypothetical protein X943_002810 [Babesia divergens]|uniref:G-patch domain-containing protein n=1 Tax=Babesia divergens TaxID=32595 RepID=A0AAD9GD82_BABDI|nr:hypothetical protein X943_002810 [Babesia divergens]
MNGPHINIKIDPRSSSESRRDGSFHSFQRAGHVSYNPDDAYDPRFPNDYERLSREMSQRFMQPASKVELNIEKADTITLSADEAHARRLRLLDEMEKQKSTGAQAASSDGSKDVGLKILQKLGWKEGKGLGANEQGIMAPLVAKNLGRNVGVIMQDTTPVSVKKITKGRGSMGHAGAKSRDPRENGDAGISVTPDSSVSRILKISCHEWSRTAEELQEEYEEVMSQFGSLINSFVLPSSEDNAFILYCEFEEAEQAQAAMSNIKKLSTRGNSTFTFASEEEYTSIQT